LYWNDLFNCLHRISDLSKHLGDEAGKSQAELKTGTSIMGKRKNSMQSHLLANNLLFNVLSIVAIILGAVFLYFGLFFSVLTISAVSGDFALMTYLQSGIFISASLLIVSMFASNKQSLSAQGLNTQEERVSRLVDNAAEDDAQQSASSEIYQQNKQ
jgi:vacuolar-type H+-ATPase subunit I/STV1